jgi:uncharacterized protein YjbJ (UPF0337 family)
MSDQEPENNELAIDESGRNLTQQRMDAEGVEDVPVDAGWETPSESTDERKGPDMDDRVEGKLKEGEGKLTGDKGREAEGKAQGGLGKAKDAAGDLRDAAQDKADDVKR